jgi:hypothetical protein
MIRKTVAAAVAASFLLVAAAPVFAADAAAPTTKSDCLKTQGMKWDAKTHTCVKK